MLEEEKHKLRAQYADKKELLERRVRIQNEQRIAEMQDRMKQEFGHQQRVAENRHKDELMEKERQIAGRIQEMERRAENEIVQRERQMEETVHKRIAEKA